MKRVAVMRMMAVSTPAAKPMPRAADGERRDVGSVGVADGDAVVVDAGGAEVYAASSVKVVVMLKVITDVGLAIVCSKDSRVTRCVLAAGQLLSSNLSIPLNAVVCDVRLFKLLKPFRTYYHHAYHW
jgi:hypothetical protein